MMGATADPKKVALYRAASRAHAECTRRGSCAADAGGAGPRGGGIVTGTRAPLPAEPAEPDVAREAWSDDEAVLQAARALVAPAAAMAKNSLTGCCGRMRPTSHCRTGPSLSLDPSCSPNAGQNSFPVPTACQTSKPSPLTHIWKA